MCVLCVERTLRTYIHTFVNMFVCLSHFRCDGVGCVHMLLKIPPFQPNVLRTLLRTLLSLPECIHTKALITILSKLCQDYSVYVIARPKQIREKKHKQTYIPTLVDFCIYEARVPDDGPLQNKREIQCCSLKNNENTTNI